MGGTERIAAGGGRPAENQRLCGLETLYVESILLMGSFWFNAYKKGLPDLSG